MTIEMVQMKLNCPYCGQYLWTAKRTVYNMDTKAWELAESTAYCEKCEKAKHLGILKNADKVVPLTEEQRKT